MSRARFSTHLGLRDPNRAQLAPDDPDQSAAARVARAAAAGFGGVFDNYLMLRGADYQQALAGAARAQGLAVTSFVHDPANWNTPGWIDGGALATVAETARVARLVGARCVLAITAPGEGGGAAQATAFVDNLRRAADRCAAQALTFCVETTHPAFAPGLMLERLEDALEIVARADHPQVGLALDIGHLALQGYDPVAVVAMARGAISLVQLADVPGRVEPGAGTLDWPAIVAALDVAGYRGMLELECEPKNDDAAFLKRITVLEDAT